MIGRVVWAVLLNCIAPPLNTIMFDVGPMRTSRVSVPGVVTMLPSWPANLTSTALPARSKKPGFSVAFACALSNDDGVVEAVRFGPAACIVAMHSV